MDIGSGSGNEAQINTKVIHHNLQEIEPVNMITHTPDHQSSELGPGSNRELTQSNNGTNDNSVQYIDRKDFYVPIILTVEDTNFLLIQNEDVQVKPLSKLVALFDDSIINYSINKLFQLIRKDEDLIELHNMTDREEMVLVVPELKNIRISEDNIYSREIAIKDFVMMFRALKKTGTLRFMISKQERFITKFNDLNDLIRAEYKKRKFE